MSKNKKSKIVFALSTVFFFISISTLTFQISTTEVSAQGGICELFKYEEVCCGELCMVPEPWPPGSNYCIQGEDNQYTCCDCD